MSYGLGKQLSLVEIGDAIANRLEREHLADPRPVIVEILNKHIRGLLVYADSELSAIAHHRPPERETCDLLSHQCRQLLGER